MTPSLLLYYRVEQLDVDGTRRSLLRIQSPLPIDDNDVVGDVDLTRRALADCWHRWQWWHRNATVARDSSCASPPATLRPADDWRWIARVRVNGAAFDWFVWGADSAPTLPRFDQLPASATVLESNASSLDGAPPIVAVAAQRSFQCTGFHGVLSTRVSLPAALQQCRLRLIEFLPRALFVDEYQLRSLEQFDALRPRATLSSAVDLEVPIYSARAIDFAVRLELNGSNSDAALFELPVHGRYQQPQRAEQYTDLTIDAPLLLVQCGRVDAPWRPVHLALSNESAQLQWRLPNGVSSHFPIVKWGTISTTVIGALMVILAVLLAHKR